MKYEQWKRVPQDEAALRALSGCRISPLAAQTQAGRGIAKPEQAAAFLRSDEGMLHDPLRMRDMDRAVARVELALERGETIAVYGDYDVDGITSTALLTTFLRARGARVIPYIPDRLAEGYSLNTAAVTKLALQGAKLLITVDCGITNRKEADFARGIGVDVIITDHHECREELPRCCAVVNPHRSDCPYPYKDLAGVGVALKLALALTPEPERHRVLREYADLSTIGTVADVMNLTGENRAIVALGLKLLPQVRRPGLRALMRECSLEDKAITASTIGFTLAPRINAAGRMGCPQVALELLLTGDADRARSLAQSLCDLNRERQGIEQEIFSQCLTLLEEHPELARDAIVLAGRDWHQGVVGIVASRLADRFSVPAFMICLDEEGRGKGSCRSWGGLNLFQSLEQAEQLLESFGGHELAAGFTILEEQIPAFRERMQSIARAHAAGRRVASQLTIDAVLDSAQLLSLENVADLQRLEPFGTGNPQPTFALTGATVSVLAPVGKGRHTRLKIIRDGVSFNAILFSYAPEDTGLRIGCKADLAFTVQINRFRDRSSVQLILSDWRPQLSLAQVDRLLYQRWRNGERFSPQEVDMLLPQRQDFVSVWRYLSAHAAADRFQDSPARLARNIARSAGQREAYARTMICLEVFQERGLIGLDGDASVVRIRINQVSGKVDLEQSAILRTLREMLED